MSSPVLTQRRAVLCFSHRGELFRAAKGTANFAVPMGGFVPVQLLERFCCGLTAGKGKKRPSFVMPSQLQVAGKQQPSSFPLAAGSSVHKCNAAHQNKRCLRTFFRLKFWRGKKKETYFSGLIVCASTYMSFALCCSKDVVIFFFKS